MFHAAKGVWRAECLFRNQTTLAVRYQHDVSQVEAFQVFADNDGHGRNGAGVVSELVRYMDRMTCTG